MLKAIDNKIFKISHKVPSAFGKVASIVDE